MVRWQSFESRRSITSVFQVSHSRNIRYLHNWLPASYCNPESRFIFTQFHLDGYKSVIPIWFAISTFEIGQVWVNCSFHKYGFHPNSKIIPEGDCAGTKPKEVLHGPRNSTFWTFIITWDFHFKKKTSSWKNIMEYFNLKHFHLSISTLTG